jgi:hypothetical protein
MTDTAQRLSRARRAAMFMDEFLTPMFTELRDEYTSRLAEVARTELNIQRRAEAVGMLSVALKVVDTLESGMAEIVRDGELARQSKARADKVLQMSDAQQRLLKIGAGY